MGDFDRVHGLTLTIQEPLLSQVPAEIAKDGHVVEHADIQVFIDKLHIVAPGRDLDDRKRGPIVEDTRSPGGHASTNFQKPRRDAPD